MDDKNQPNQHSDNQTPNVNPQPENSAVTEPTSQIPPEVNPVSSSIPSQQTPPTHNSNEPKPDSNLNTLNAGFNSVPTLDSKHPQTQPHPINTTIKSQLQKSSSANSINTVKKIVTGAIILVLLLASGIYGYSTFLASSDRDTSTEPLLPTPRPTTSSVPQPTTTTLPSTPPPSTQTSTPSAQTSPSSDLFQSDIQPPTALSNPTSTPIPVQKQIDLPEAGSTTHSVMLLTLGSAIVLLGVIGLAVL